ncbi:MAG TPA: hypothetical protein DEQ98_04190 [Acidobacteria bacterium]|nr:hypothetical protein [Acidobacteriota bacterium]|tara:strand:- start:63 stop:272 length:210 start_codon:yes stop_codon:yes gene_type:complete
MAFDWSHDGREGAMPTTHRGGKFTRIAGVVLLMGFSSQFSAQVDLSGSLAAAVGDGDDGHDHDTVYLWL